MRTGGVLTGEPRDANLLDGMILMVILVCDTTGEKCTLRRLMAGITRWVGLPTFEDLDRALARLEAYGLMRAVEDCFTATERARAAKSPGFPQGEPLPPFERVLATARSSLAGESRAGLISEAQYRDASNPSARRHTIACMLGFLFAMDLAFRDLSLLFASARFMRCLICR